MDRHSFDFVSLVFGLAFAAIGIAIATGSLRLEDAGLESAIPLGIGFVGLILAALTLNRYMRANEDTELASEEASADLAGEERPSFGEAHRTTDPL